MKRSTKELLRDILSRQESIMRHLNIANPEVTKPEKEKTKTKALPINKPKKKAKDKKKKVAKKK